MKKIVMLVLMLALVLSLYACGQAAGGQTEAVQEPAAETEDDETDTADTEAETAGTDAEEETADVDTEEETADADAEAETEDTDSEAEAGPSGEFDMELTAMALASDMKAGWNLGNSLDAFSGSGLSSETSWGNPKTTQALVQDIRDMGFTTIRIPVTWGIHADDTGHVDEEWMARVKEVVDYAYGIGMYVILNTHHDNSYYDIGGCVESEETYEKTLAKMTGLWTEIAETFRDYDEHLVFETLNEPRTEGSANEWSGGTKEEREIVYGLNEAIVQAIRATGGNNAYRFIMVPCYGATNNMDVLRTMTLPEDDRILVSVHAYSPYLFAMAESGGSEFTNSDRVEITAIFRSLNNIFIQKGIPVVIGEYGCTNKDNLEDRIAWAEHYVSTAKGYGIPCVVWDNNSPKGQTGEECFGLYDRKAGEWLFPELVETMIRAAE